MLGVPTNNNYWSATENNSNNAYNWNWNGSNWNNNGNNNKNNTNRVRCVKEFAGGFV